MIIVKKKYEAIVESTRNLPYLNNNEYDLNVEEATSSMMKSIQDFLA